MLNKIKCFFGKHKLREGYITVNRTDCVIEKRIIRLCEHCNYLNPTNLSIFLEAVGFGGRGYGCAITRDDDTKIASIYSRNAKNESK